MARKEEDNTAYESQATHNRPYKEIRRAEGEVDLVTTSRNVNRTHDAVGPINWGSLTLYVGLPTGVVGISQDDKARLGHLRDHLHLI